MKKKIIGAIVAIVVLVCLASSVYVVGENEFKLVRQFGKVNYVVSDAGSAFQSTVYSRVRIRCLRNC